MEPRRYNYRWCTQSLEIYGGSALNIIIVLVGAALLLLGRQLYWLFVAAIGFALGAYLATSLLEAQLWVIVVVALAAGLAGAFLAHFAQRLAVGAAGFVAGGIIALQFQELLAVNADQLTWLLFLIGGVIGALLVSVLFDWALIILSSLVGAGLIVQQVDLRLVPDAIATAVLVAIGIVVQATALRRRRPKGDD